jgi:hypothetical protein
LTKAQSGQGLDAVLRGEPPIEGGKGHAQVCGDLPWRTTARQELPRSFNLALAHQPSATANPSTLACCLQPGPCALHRQLSLHLSAIRRGLGAPERRARLRVSRMRTCINSRAAGIAAWAGAGPARMATARATLGKRPSTPIRASSARDSSALNGATRRTTKLTVRRRLRAGGGDVGGGNARTRRDSGDVTPFVHRLVGVTGGPCTPAST